MAKHTKETTIELVTEDPTSPPLSDESRMEERLDSYLSLSKVLTGEGSVEVNNNGRASSTSPSLSKGESWGEGIIAQNMNGVSVGTLISIDQSGTPYVEFQGNPSTEPIPARTTTNLERFPSDKEVVLMFEHGDLRKPIILGALYSSDNKPPGRSKNAKSEENRPTDIEIDCERLTFTGKKEIVLKCGKASITLTKAGKILIRGAYLLSRSSGVNRVKGGSVQIN